MLLSISYAGATLAWDATGPMMLVAGMFCMMDRNFRRKGCVLLLGSVAAVWLGVEWWWCAGLWLLLGPQWWLVRRRLRTAQQALAAERVDEGMHYRHMPCLTRIWHVTPPHSKMIHLCEACAMEYRNALRGSTNVLCHCQEGAWCQQAEHAYRVLVQVEYSDQPAWSVLPWQA